MGSGGGTDSSAQRAQIAANEETLEFIKQSTGQARRDVQALQGPAEQNFLTGQQSALDVFSQSMPQQLAALQQGNMGAQQTLLAGLPQIQNAILGRPTDMSQIQPQAVQYDAGFTQQQLPQFASSADALAPTANEQMISEQQQIIDALTAAVNPPPPPETDEERLAREFSWLPRYSRQGRGDGQADGASPAGPAGRQGPVGGAERNAGRGSMA